MRSVQIVNMRPVLQLWASGRITQTMGHGLHMVLKQWSSGRIQCSNCGCRLDPVFKLWAAGWIRLFYVYIYSPLTQVKEKELHYFTSIALPKTKVVVA